jgi:hypothetical protein
MGLRPSGLSRLTQVPFGDYDLPPLRRAVPPPWLTDSAFAAAILRRSKKLIPNQSVLALTARNCALQNCMLLIPKTKQALRVGHDET